MKSIKLALVLFAAIAGSLVSAAADAHGWRHRARIGVFIGAPVVGYSYYAYPRYYYPASVVVPAPAPVYVEPTPPAPAPTQSANYWYYCRDSGAYYPYVQTCPSPWQPVVPN